MNKTIEQFTDPELQQTLLQLTIQREVISSQVAMLVAEIMKRQAAPPAPKPESILLPKLRKLTPNTGSGETI